MTIPGLMLAFLCCSLLAGEQHISIRSSPEVYTATADDSLPARMRLQLIPVLSPLISTNPPVSPYLTAIGNSGDKVMIAPKLEDCRHGRPNCPPTTVNDAFLNNAEANLDNGRKQVRDLKQERLPKSLEPVRRFLLDNLTATLRMEEVRYKYIKTGDVGPVGKMLAQYCTTGQEGLIHKLSEAPDAEKRRELSWYDWSNTVWNCYRERSGKYPLEAWKLFVRQYHLRELVTPEPE